MEKKIIYRFEAAKPEKSKMTKPQHQVKTDTKTAKERNRAVRSKIEIRQSEIKQKKRTEKNETDYFAKSKFSEIEGR